LLRRIRSRSIAPPLSLLLHRPSSSACEPPADGSRRACARFDV